MMFTQLLVLVVLCNGFVSLMALTITNGPKNTTVCMGDEALCPCGFVGASPATTLPRWHLTQRKNGVPIEEMIDSRDITANTTDSLDWISATTSGLNDGRNSRLRVNTTDGRFNQTLFQCSFFVAFSIISSSIGTMTIHGPPVMSSITMSNSAISWTTTSHTVCGDVTYTITLSPLPVGTNRSMITTNTSYTFTKVQCNISYAVAVYGANRAGVGKVVSTTILFGEMPDAITGLEISSSNDTAVTVNWKELRTNLHCDEQTVKYRVTYFINDSEIYNETTDTTIILPRSAHNITVLAINSLGAGPASEPINVTPQEDGPDNDNSYTTVIIITVVIVVVMVTILTFIIVCIVWYRRKQHKSVSLELKQPPENNYSAEPQKVYTPANSNTEEYSYVRTGPRTVGFSSNPN